MLSGVWCVGWVRWGGVGLGSVIATRNHPPLAHPLDCRSSAQTSHIPLPPRRQQPFDGCGWRCAPFASASHPFAFVPGEPPPAGKRVPASASCGTLRFVASAIKPPFGLGCYHLSLPQFGGTPPAESLTPARTGRWRSFRCRVPLAIVTSHPPPLSKPEGAEGEEGGTSRLPAK